MEGENPFDDVHTMLTGEVRHSTVQAYAAECRRYLAFCSGAGHDPTRAESLRAWRHRKRALARGSHADVSAVEETLSWL